MSKPQIISGQVLVGEELELQPADVIIEQGSIRSIEENKKAPNLWICPAFYNAHTHLGDTIAMDCGITGDLVALVTPPNGLKHRILAQATPSELTAGMRSSIQNMMRRGTAGCSDFREGGISGIRALRDAAAGLPFHALAFGREGGEATGDGLGISSVRDVPGAEDQVRAARAAGKKVAFHAGERDAEDIDAALALDPDFIVHATHATKKQLRECADRQIPIVVCPRSNWILGVTSSGRRPPLRQMQSIGCTILLGTDNVMFVPPDLFGEMAFANLVYKIDPVDILRAAVLGSGLSGSPFFIKTGAKANLFVINPGESGLACSRDPLASIIRRGASVAVDSNVFNL